MTASILKQDPNIWNLKEMQIVGLIPVFKLKKNNNKKQQHLNNG